jgi:hypothetical protein
MIQRLPKKTIDAICKFQPKEKMETLVDANVYVVETMGEVGAVGAITKAIAIAMIVASQRMLHALPVDLSNPVSILLGLTWRSSVSEH